MIVRYPFEDHSYDACFLTKHFYVTPLVGFVGNVNVAVRRFTEENVAIFHPTKLAQSESFGDLRSFVFGK